MAPCRTAPIRTIAFALAAALALAAPATAVLLSLAAGEGNVTAPGAMPGEPADPGWANVGTRGALSVVYLGDGWVISARHVGVTSVVFDGVEHQALTDTRTFFTNVEPPGGIPDLQAFRLVSDPGLPPLSLVASPPPIGAEVVLIGHGRNRGSPLTWSGRDGWRWGSGNAMRWGTNRISRTGFDQSLSGTVTRSLAAHLDVTLPLDTAFEAIAAQGDSGGAVFYGQQLAGIMFAVTAVGGQPAGTSVEGNETLIVDLSHYADQIASVTAERACSDGRDDDGDGLVDLDDPGCRSATDAFETDASRPCDDGLDDDGDGLIDAADPGCLVATSPREDPACDDDADNDGDGRIDWDGGAGGATPDPSCTTAPWGSSEAPLCGLGFELALLLPLLSGLRRLRRR